MSCIMQNEIFRGSFVPPWPSDTRGVRPAGRCPSGADAPLQAVGVSGLQRGPGLLAADAVCPGPRRLLVGHGGHGRGGRGGR
eukprot:scaffold222717_cov18-Prasinocladus_malaysianus.AAC.1